MFKKLKTWLTRKDSEEEWTPPVTLSRTGANTAIRPRKSNEQQPPAELQLEEDFRSGHIESGGPNKNVFVRHKYVREDTGTHETLKILDDSLVDFGDEKGIDPYNTGGFDRSNNWNNRFRK
ncbi:MAG: hypothetical protein GWP67_04700 [Gammaproteobacteria bacterium]|jgi:hypothetical protein|nr:hypothetical protein [Gammaproteobacteria bacterium]